MKRSNQSSILTVSRFLSVLAAIVILAQASGARADNSSSVHSLFLSSLGIVRASFGLIPLPALVPAPDSTNRDSTKNPSFLRPDSARFRSADVGARKNGGGGLEFPLPTKYKHSIALDSSLSRFRVRETMEGADFSVPQSLTVDEYLERRREFLRKKAWDSLSHQYTLKWTPEDELNKILGQVTNLSIPIPQNPLMSIFGKPEISINVNGEINVRAGWRWDSQNLGTASAFGQTQSGPMFSQDINMNVSGKIGDKFKIGVDWKTARPFEFDNTFKVGFEGYDDDIIKRVEAGNVQMPTPSTLIGGSQQLFGVRADFQFGPLMLKTVASQKRGQRKTVSLRGGSLKQQFGLRAYDYDQRHFFLDTAYKTIFKKQFSVYPPLPIASSLSVKEIEVWESTVDVKVQGTDAIAYADLNYIPVGKQYPATLKTAQITSGTVERGRFIKLTDKQQFEYDPNLGKLSILAFQPGRTYAVAYRIEGKTTVRDDDSVCGTFAGSISPKDTLILKLVYRPNMQPGWTSIWARQMKNIYQIGATNINISDTRIGVWYFRNTNDSTDVLEGASEKIPTVLGVDRVNNSNNNPPSDGIFDIQSPYFFNPQRGEIMFSNLEPFRAGLIDYFSAKGSPQLANRYIFGAVYDTTVAVARLQTERDRFVISGEVSGTAGGSRIQLPGGFNLAQGSVRVTLDGAPLRENDDYNVEYYSGMVILRNPRALLPNANINIEYEQNDIFNLSTKTLVGARADWDMRTLLRSRDIKTNLGMTFMMYDQALQIDRVRIGEEPVNNMMLGFDGQFSWDAKWLTKAIDALPFLDTKEPSSLSLRGEWAMMMPEPNKKKSDVPSDAGKSVVYVDDFEGSQRYIPLGLTPSQWTFSSPPQDNFIGIDDTTRSLYRGQMNWFRYFIPRTASVEVYPNRQTPIGSPNISEMIIQFDPDFRGIYNHNANYVDSLTPNFQNYPYFSRIPANRQKIWGGITRLLSSFNTNFDTENIDYIEIMMRIEKSEPTTKMYLDLGQISEDIIPNQQLNTEDGITSANPLANGIIDEGEDVGIDAFNDAQEKIAYPFPINQEADPARDNYAFDFQKADIDRQDADFQKANNFEGNASISQTGQFPDTEVLNKNNGQTISLDNSYFEYEVNLNTDPNTNQQIIGGGSNGWYLYRIPIRGKKTEVGKPLFSNIQYVRLWFKGGPIRVRIADWRLAGAQWQRFTTLPDGTTDTTVNIAFVNREENSGAPDYYTLPPGVSPPRQLNADPNQDIRLNEQSLSVSVKNLRYGDEKTAVRFFRPFDMFYYKNMKFFIHGDGTMPLSVTPGSIPQAIAYIRFGIDSLNYYEYRRPLVQGWQEVDIPMAQLTAIKQIRDSARSLERQEFAVPGDALAKFAIKGSPILTKVQFIGFGVANPPERFPNTLTTTMWVDELRLIDAENSNDWAGVVNSQIKLADLGNINFSYNRTNPNFHRLEERFGNRIESTTWSFSAQAGLEKFIPKEWGGTSIPISYTHNESMLNPVFAAQSDVDLASAAAAAERKVLEAGGSAQEAISAADATRTRSQTYVVQDAFALTGLRIGLPFKQWYIRDTFNKLIFGYNYAQQYERSPVVAERFNWQWTFTTAYSATISQDYYVKPLTWLAEIPILSAYKDLKIMLVPANFSASWNLTRSRTTEQSRFLDMPSPVYRTFNAQRQYQFSWRLTEGGLLNTTWDYNTSAFSTLLPVELDENQRQRTGSQIFSDMFFKDGKFVNLGEDSRYTQGVTLTFKPKMPPVFSIDRFMDVTGSFTTNYTWDNQLQQNPEIRDIAKSASFDNTIRFGIAFRLKSLGESWFNSKPNPRGGPAATLPPDTTNNSITATLLKVIKTVFFDYDNLTLNFNQTNNAKNPGVFGGNGSSNFWARAPFFRQQEEVFGPTAAYQLGLVGSPHGTFSFVGSSVFPFFGFETDYGRRPANATLPENYAQQTSLELRTSRPLWTGATLELNWRSQFAFNQNQTVLTDSAGRPSFSNIANTQSYNRTYLSIPSFLIFSAFDNNVKNVIRKYKEQLPNIEATAPDTTEKNRRKMEALAEAFEDGLEALSFFPRPIQQILPRMNWSFRWEGIEKWGIWNGIARTVSLEHKYASTFQENVRITDNGKNIESQQMELGFQPLIGLTMGFDERKLDGNMTATMRYNTKTGYRLSSSARATISRDVANELAIQITYNKRSWEFPLFGLSLKNDLELSLNASYRRTKRSTFDIEEYDGDAGRSLDGTTQILIEPRARYTMSRNVTASFFVRYEANLTEGAAQAGTQTTQVGLDLRISVSGGR